ncbi:ATP synthase subunit I [Nocardioides sp. CN2-186]|uniref:ATP synthase subunit I n=1 Tax=Nocardioides tweenelious TaxID=3156607 RepID=UPI0032B6023D
MSIPVTDDVTPPKASIWRVVKDQRKIELFAVGLMVAGFWIVGQLGEWRLAACIAVGVGFGLVNHLATEYWLLKLISSGAQPTRNQMIMSTVVRLTVLTVVAVAVAVFFWPDGIGLLLGLAIFRLIALVMTTIPLLKELKNP